MVKFWDCINDYHAFIRYGQGVSHTDGGTVHFLAALPASLEQIALCSIG
jgi:hypothetical protein